MISAFEPVKLLSNTYPFNSSLLTIAIGNTSYNKKRYLDLQGYVPLAGYYKGSIPHSLMGNGSDIDTNKVKIYTAFVKRCKELNIKLYIVISPFLNGATSTQSSLL